MRHALAELMSALAPLNLEIEDAGVVEIVIAEILNNIVKHAYLSTNGSGPIGIRCTHKKNGLHFRITDSGGSMPNNQLPDGAAANLDGNLADLPESGFGWPIIKSLAKDVYYQRLDQKNRLDMRLEVAMPPGDATL
ncbi:MAG: ATP-binding protein [Sulfitobacter sp.]